MAEKAYVYHNRHARFQDILAVGAKERPAGHVVWGRLFGLAQQETFAVERRLAARTGSGDRFKGRRACLEV